jgi:HK97 family phage major capsid protein
MSMNAVETRVEIQNLFKKCDDIESHYPDGEITNNEDAAEVKRLLMTIDEHEARLATLEDSEQRHDRIQAGLIKYVNPQRPTLVPPDRSREQSEGKRVSPGTQFTAAREYTRLVSEGVFNSNLNRVEFAVSLKDGTSLVEWHQRTELEKKALLTGASSTSGGALVINDIRPGTLDLLLREVTVLDIVPRLTTSSDTVEYVREDTFTNNAAFTPEASASTGTSGSKPESALAYSTQTTTVQSMAHYIPITNRLLADAPAIRGIIDGRLLLGLALKLEDQILTGDGTGVNFLGILNTPNVLTQGLTGSDNRLDAIFRARTQVRVTGHARPSVVILHPNDFQDIRLLREGTGTGQYLMGPPSAAGATTVWGMPVVESEAITENTGLVADMVNGCSLFDREQAAVRVGLINDQFIRNMQTILAELRAAFVVWRPTAFCRVTGI